MLSAMQRIHSKERGYENNETLDEITWSAIFHGGFHLLQFFEVKRIPYIKQGISSYETTLEEVSIPWGLFFQVVASVTVTFNNFNWAKVKLIDYLGTASLLIVSILVERAYVSCFCQKAVEEKSFEFISFFWFWLFHLPKRSCILNWLLDHYLLFIYAVQGNVPKQPLNRSILAIS